jgi:hypothetical protein
MMDSDFNSEWGSRQVSFNTKVDVQELKDMADIFARPMELSALEHEDADVDTVMAQHAEELSETPWDTEEYPECDVVNIDGVEWHYPQYTDEQLAEFEAELEEARQRISEIDDLADLCD